MDKALEIYGYILKEYLSKCFANQQNINPVELNKERFKVKSVFIASIIFLKNNPKIEDFKIVSSSNQWLKESFAVENLFSFFIDNANEELIKLVDDNLCNLRGIESIDVPTFYETLLGIESNGTNVSKAKNYPRAIYYQLLPKSIWFLAMAIEQTETND